MLNLQVEWKKNSFEMRIDLSVNSPFLAIFGPSGAGKSTLLKIIAGLIKPDKGTVELAGRILFDSNKKVDLPPHKRRIGYVFQDGRLFPHLSVEKNLLYGYHLVAELERKFSFEQVCEIMAIRPLLQRGVNTLSGGEVQRVALGRALLMSPQLLLMDEPVSALDVALKNQVITFIQRIKKELAIPILYVSHSLADILQLTDQLAVLEAGKLLASGNYYSVINQPAVFSLVNSLGLENILPVTVLRHEDDYQVTIVSIDGSELVVPLKNVSPGESHFISIHPEDIVLAKDSPQNLSAQNTLAGKIHHIAQVSDRLLVQVDIGLLLLVEITLKAAEKLKLQPGVEVYCLIKTYACHWQDIT